MNFDELTWGELELLEREFDKPLSEIDLESMRAVMVLAWIAKRRVEPQTTLDDIRNLPLTAVEVVETEVADSPLDDDASASVEDDITGSQSSQ